MSSAKRKKRRDYLYSKQNGLCYYCKCEMSMDKNDMFKDNYTTIDHIIPVAYGGTNDESNHVACCLNCNREGSKRISKECNEKILKKSVS